MPKVKINRFLQDPGFCAVATCATLANFYDSSINYNYVKELLKIDSIESFDGLDSGEIGILLNKLGFKKVTIVTSDFKVVDYSWENYGRKRLVECLLRMRDRKTPDGYVDCKDFYKWLKDFNYDNNLIIDYNFSYYIKKFLDKKIPIALSFNWTMFFKYTKEKDYGALDSYRGSYSHHIVVAYGYDNRGVYICDSHHKLYKYKRKKYRNGFYKISWENLMTIMGQGDLFLAENYTRE